MPIIIMTFILHAVTQQPSSPQQQPASVQHQLLSSATGHQPQFGKLLLVLPNTCANLYCWSTSYDHHCESMTSEVVFMCGLPPHDFSLLTQHNQSLIISCSYAYMHTQKKHQISQII